MVRRTQVEEQLVGLEVNADDLEKMISTLEGRLRSVTQVLLERESKDGNIPQIRPVLVPLAERLEKSISRIRGSIDRLRELNANIELTE